MDRKLQPPNRVDTLKKKYKAEHEEVVPALRPHNAAEAPVAFTLPLAAITDACRGSPLAVVRELAGVHGSNLMRHENLVIKPELIGCAWLRSHSSLDHVLARDDNCVTAAFRRACLRKDSSAHFLLAANLQNIERKGLDMIRGMHIIIWDAATTTHDFTFYADRLMEGLNKLLAMQVPLTAVTSIIDGLKRLYTAKLKPLEVAYRFNDFASPLL
ncbi:hypothetical protein ABZP36_028307, partial [Zizania latifolia]